MVATNRLKLKPLPVIFLMAALSYAAGHHLIRHDKIGAFYAPYGRGWELMLGAMLAGGREKLERLTSLLRLRQAFAFIGLAMVAFSFFYLKEGSVFPGAHALPVTVGTCLLIVAGADTWIGKWFLSNRLAVSIGLISYPLYLWHWPLLVIPAIYLNVPLSPEMRIMMVCASFILAAGTYRLVERPIRSAVFLEKRYNKRIVLAGVTASAVVALIGWGMMNGALLSVEQKNNSLFTVYENRGGKVESAYFGKDKSCFLVSDPAALNVDAFERNHCYQEKFSGHPAAFIIGDSHAAYISKGLQPYLEARGINVGLFAAAFCTPLSLHDKRERCRAINTYVLDKIRTVKPAIVIIFAYYADHTGDLRQADDGEQDDYENYIAERAGAIATLGVKHVVVIGQMPTWQGTLPKVLGRFFVMRDRPIPDRTWRGIDPGSIAMAGRMSKIVWPQGVTYISLKDGLCTVDGCLTRVGDNLQTDLLVQDYGHLTFNGAAFVANNVLDAQLAPIVSDIQKNTVQ